MYMVSKEHFANSNCGALVALFLMLLTISPRAQTDEEAAVREVLPPKAEKFVEADGVLLPWRSTDSLCDHGSANPKSPCRVITDVEFHRSHILSLYESDGNLWFRFSIEPRDPAYFLDDTTHIIRPIGPDPHRLPYIILRLVRESRSWYEAEINDNTRETRFVRKDDPLWSKASWSEIFNMSVNVVVDQSKTRLRDAPNGKIIADYVDVKFARLRFRKLEGDWMYVEGIAQGTLYFGWIQWRNGRDILVGSILNGMKVPQVKNQ